ncbi:MAG: Flp pilus assembly complex ATPase component TadA [Erysipelotrichia bacterium]|jgi:pilus assembly protein CpaF|nr:Flp pilus assembly complex ATPase component TadA [Erysipelotrichia bacterium]
MFDYSVIAPYIQDDLITDINYNGQDLWCDHLKKGRYKIHGFSFHQQMQQLAYRFANHVNQTFNPKTPLVEAQFDGMRWSMVHESIASKLSISIRKTPMIARLTTKSMIKEAYAPIHVIEYLIQAVKDRKNILVSGLPGAGKTELIKFLTSAITPYERIITIEDTLEMHVRSLYPHLDCVSLKVSDSFTYQDAIKASLRQRPDWILVSEVRSKEVYYLLQSMSTGTHCLSTIHAPNASLIPQRLIHMIPGHDLSYDQMMALIHDAIDIGVHIQSTITKKGITRFIKEVVSFSLKESHQPHIEVVYLRPQNHLEGDSIC